MLEIGFEWVIRKEKLKWNSFVRKVIVINCLNCIVCELDVKSLIILLVLLYFVLINMFKYYDVWVLY